MKFDRAQIQAIQQQQCVDDHALLKQALKEGWQLARPQLRPILVEASEAQLDAWIQACYEDCIRAQVDTVRDCVRYTLAVLRALHLGVGQGFINGLRGHLGSRPGCAPGSLMWIEHVVEQVHRQRVAESAAEAAVAAAAAAAAESRGLRSA